ncbi:hypothetical protein IFR05_001975 [Cadophora sp. M221]|nr:hypothetical protein IFR05_001975 [Cadophora sp. M221]
MMRVQLDEKIYNNLSRLFPFLCDWSRTTVEGHAQSGRIYRTAVDIDVFFKFWMQKNAAVPYDLAIDRAHAWKQVKCLKINHHTPSLYNGPLYEGVIAGSAAHKPAAWRTITSTVKNEKTIAKLLAENKAGAEKRETEVAQAIAQVHKLEAQLAEANGRANRAETLPVTTRKLVRELQGIDESSDDDLGSVSVSEDTERQEPEAEEEIESKTSDDVEDQETKPKTDVEGKVEFDKKKTKPEIDVEGKVEEEETKPETDVEGKVEEDGEVTAEPLTLDNVKSEVEVDKKVGEAEV